MAWTKMRLSSHPLYKTWRGMHDRCSNPSNNSYRNYGERGISVCIRWDSFLLFRGDMGSRPEGHSLDRIDNDGNYEPDNCRWATRKQQCRNTRRNVMVEYKGRKVTIAELSEVTGIDKSLLYNRIIYRGRTVDEAVNAPVWGLSERTRTSPWKYVQYGHNKKAAKK